MTESVKHPSLASALAAFQLALPKVGKDNTAQVGNYSYDYADLSDVNAVVLPALAQHGMSFSAKPTLTEDGRFVLEYVLRHESGDADGGQWPLPATGTPQQIGSAVTYYRRYVLCAMAGVAPDKDDDGQAAQREHTYGHSSRVTEQAIDTNPARLARDRLRAAAKGMEVDLAKLVAVYEQMHDVSLARDTDADRIDAFHELLKVDMIGLLDKEVAS